MATKHPTPELVAFVRDCEHKADCVKVGLDLPDACETCILFRERGKESLKEEALEAAMLLRHWWAHTELSPPKKILDHPDWPTKHNNNDRHLWKKLPLLPASEET